MAASRLSLGVGRPPKEAVEPPKRTTRGAKAAAPKARTATTRARAPPVTPKKRRGEFDSFALGRKRVERRLTRRCPYYQALDPVSLNTASPKIASGGPVQGKMEFDDFTKLIKQLRESASLGFIIAFNVLMAVVQAWSPT